MISTSPPFAFPPLDALPTRLLTVEDLAALPTDLPSGPVDYELDNGRIVIMAPPGDLHGASQSNIATELKIQGERRGHGKARTEVGVILRRNPDHVLCPDALFVANHNLPLRCSKEGYLETIPDLVVEIEVSRSVLNRLGILAALGTATGLSHEDEGAAIELLGAIDLDPCGVADPARAKVLVKCAAGIQKAAAKFTASRPEATWSVSSNVALNAGSSQQGNPRRQSVACIWVVAMTRSTPSPSRYVLR